MIEKATREQTRILNQGLILKTIYHSEGISRAEIARVTGLTRPTVSDVVVDLMEQGIVVEVGYGPSTGGRPPICLSVDREALHLIGIDLAIGDYRGAILDLRGNILHRDRRRFSGTGEAASLSALYDLLDALMASATRPILGIAVGAPGLIDAVAGVMVQGINQDWHDVPLRELLERRYEVPAYVANDCHVAALGEYTFGESDRDQDLVVINIEWGIGSGIVLGGKLFHGNPLGAGEIGHVRVVEDGVRCRCGKYGCLETVASAQSIVSRVQELVRQAAAVGNGGDGEKITFETVCEMHAKHDPLVKEVIEDAARGLGVAASNLVGILGSCHIRLAGRVTCLGESFLEMIRTEIAQRSLTALAENTDVAFTNLGEDIVILGAAALLLTRELGVY
ncbi:MAG: ROK family transcriptional regulator [Anaerolineae bacterium]